MAPKKLTRRQKVFVEYYLQTWNATRAAELAGYQNPNKAAYTLVRQELVKEEIASRLKELRLSADEVLARLTQQACNEAAAYIEPDGTVDLPRLIADGKSHLIKGIKYDRRGKMMVEFYDAQTALIQLGRAHGLFVDKLEHNGNLRVNLTADDLAKARDQAKSYERDLLNGADQRQDTGANQ